MTTVVWDVVIVLVIVSIGGFFASAEMALVSLREGQVQSLAKRGKRGATAARLAADPNRFLSSVQIGMTLATLVAGSFGADTLVGLLHGWLVRHQLSDDVASPVAFVIVTVCITFVSLVLGELAPKRIALQRTLPLALFAAPLLDRIATLARPVVWLLSVSVNVVVRLLGGDPRAGRQAMTEQEVRELVTGTQTLDPDERRIVSEVFDAGKRQIREVLLPRTEVEFLAAGTSIGEAAEIAASVPYSRLPVYQDSYDNVVGFVHIRDLLGPAAPERSTLVDQVVRPVKFLPISKTVLAALSEMRRERAHLAIVADEYGGTAGIITLEDLVEELIGDIRDEYDSGQAVATKLPRGEVDVDGLLNLDEFAEQTSIRLPEGPYETAAGYVLAALGEVPRAGDSVTVPGYTIAVTEMDGRRIARLRVTPVPDPAPDPVPDPAPAPAPEPEPEPGKPERGKPEPDKPDGAAAAATPPDLSTRTHHNQANAEYLTGRRRSNRQRYRFPGRTTPFAAGSPRSDMRIKLEISRSPASLTPGCLTCRPLRAVRPTRLCRYTGEVAGEGRYMCLGLVGLTPF